MEKTKIKAIKKKGIIDLFFVLVAMFVLGIFVFVIYLVVTSVDDSGVFDDYDTAEKVMAQGDRALLNFDNIMIFIIVGLSLFVIISSAFVFNHPAFFILGIVLLALAILIAGVMSNAWFDFATSSAMEDIAVSYPKTDYLLQKLPFYILIMGIAALIAMNVGYRRFA